MGRVTRRGHRGPRRLTLWGPIALVLVVLAASGAAYQWDLGERWFGFSPPGTDPATHPAQVAPPAGIRLPAVTTPAPVAETAAGTADPARVRRAVGSLLKDADLGPHVVATVAGVDGGVLFSSGSGEAMPASSLKLLTTSAALQVLGPDHTFATTVVGEGPGRVVLVGGGDPLLASTRPGRSAYPHPADVVTLARETATRLEAAGTKRVKVGYDSRLFSGPAVSPHWAAGYVPDVVSPISALWVDEGRSGGGEQDPPAAAAAAFAAALAHAGIEVVGSPARTKATAGATELARVESPPLAQIVEHTLAFSDNAAAEVLARQVGLATGGEGSFAGGSKAVLKTLDGLGLDTSRATTYDGSGLSRDDRIDSRLLTSVLELTASPDHPDLRSVVTGLPVAGFTGSLVDRFAEGDETGRGVVRAKTGTLSGVSALAGTVTDRDGTPMVFALLADRIDLVDTLDARATLDDVATALAACRCASGGS